MNPPAVWVVIPAYNEAGVIAEVIAGVSRVVPAIVVIDDFSKDDTGALAARAGAVVLRHPINLGQGAALQTGIEFALARGADIIVTFDADGQHHPSDITVLINTLQCDHADFVLGSRFLGSALNLGPTRRALLRAATWLTRLTTGLRVSDAHNGLRVMTRSGALAINLRQNRMAHASEILHQIADSGLKCVEAPVTIAYTPYSLAKGQKLTGAFGIMVDLFVRSLHR